MLELFRVGAFRTRQLAASIDGDVKLTSGADEAQFPCIMLLSSALSAQFRVSPPPLALSSTTPVPRPCSSDVTGVYAERVSYL